MTTTTPEALLATPRMRGAAVKRVEDPRLLTGAGQYVDDLQFTGVTHMAIVRSPYAHARIAAVNTEKARQMPGVLAVWTGEDVKHLGEIPAQGLQGMKKPPHYLLAVGKVRHVGDPVAAVVAETRYQARDAAMTIEVEYEPLPAVTNIEEALKPDAPLLDEQLGTNQAFFIPVNVGDVEGAFRDADRVVSLRVEQPRLAPLTMEPRASLAEWDPGTQRLTVWASTQSAHGNRTGLYRFFNLDENQVRVIAPDVGGGFGAKGLMYPDEFLVPWAAMQLKRKVKYVEDRRDNLVQMLHGRGQLDDIEAAVKRDGTVLGLRVRVMTDLGAYPLNFGAFVPMLTLTMGVGTYRIKNIHYDIVGVYTNSTPTACYRGCGRPEAAYLLERLIDTIAFDLGLDPIEVRRRNFIQPHEFPYTTPTGATYDSGNYEGALTKVLEAAGYDDLRKWQAEQRAQGKVVGIGVSSYVEVTGYGPTQQGADIGGWESATVRVEPSGAVTVFTGLSPHGQGTYTVFAQIVADTLGVPMQAVNVVHGDTDKVQMGIGTFGSRAMAVGATALVNALVKVRAKVHRIAAIMLEANPDDIELRDDKYVVKGSPDKSVTLAQVARRAYAPWGFPRDLEGGLMESVFWEPASSVFPFGAHLAVAEVDRDTGRVQLRRFVAVDDVGTVMNPLLLEGQLHGGIAQGAAAALCEAMQYGEDGQLLTATLMDYAALKADDLPSIEIAHHVTPSPVNPLGAKGAGESGTVGSTPAVVNAVLDALKPFGVRHLDMPLTPEKVWRAING